jgi:hypothetical protein
MCLHVSPVGGITRWNWDGDAVVFDTTVPSHRAVVGGTRHYAIDVRQFVLTEKNAVLRHTLRERIRPYAARFCKDGSSLFEARIPGAFDFRAHVLNRWVSEHVRYNSKQDRDPWQFPEETLTLGKGDCEDRAFLLASLLLGSGVSGYHVRVAIGEVHVGGKERYDHAWVVYKNERGRWQILEPPARTAASSPRPRKSRPALLAAEVRYTPSFLFNDEHLWVVERNGHPGSIERIANRTWNRLAPKFAGDVHRSVIERALQDAPADVIEAVTSKFRRLAAVGPVIDDADWIDLADPRRTPYDPRQHFDNGLTESSWALLETHAAAFREDSCDLDAFSLAAHAIADFYAHSSYMHFAWVGGRPDPHAALFHPDTWNDEAKIHGLPNYGPSVDGEGDFDLRRFSTNRHVWSGSHDEALAYWNGKILSGRYAQGAHDHHGGVASKVAESLCQVPPDLMKPELGALPHHCEIAVDEPDRNDSHLLYEPDAYAMQFRLRFNTAVAHVRKIYETGRP